MTPPVPSTLPASVGAVMRRMQGDVPAVRGSRFAVLSESGVENDDEPMVRPAGQRRRQAVIRIPAPSGHLQCNHEPPSAPPTVRTSSGALHGASEFANGRDNVSGGILLSTAMVSVRTTEHDAESTAPDDTVSMHVEGNTQLDLTAQDSASASDLSDTVSLQSEGPEARTVSSGAETEWEYAPREVFEVRPSAYTTAAFASLDLISARDVFGQRACIMKVHPAFVRGAFRCAMRLALQEINTGMESHDTTKVSRGW